MFVMYGIWLVLWLSLGFSEAAPPQYKPVKELLTTDFIPTCREADLKLNECVKNALQAMMQRSKAGIPEINVPPSDPMVVQKAHYHFSNSLMQGQIAFRNVSIYGLSDAVVQTADLKLNKGKMQVHVETHMQSLFAKGNYKSQINLNQVKFSSKGAFNTTLSDITIVVQAGGEVHERDGHKYLKLNSISAEPRIGNLRIAASGIVPDPTLNEVILELLNQNWRQLYGFAAAEIQSTWASNLLKGFNEFFAVLPLDFVLTQD